MASVTRRGELVALVDALDMLDVASLDAAGVVLDRLLWIRGHVVVNPGFCRDLNQRAMEQSMRACALVLQAGNFGLVVLDLGDAPVDAVRRVPFTTWLRLQRLIEGSPTAGVLVGSVPMARSSGGLTIKLGGATCGASDAGPMSRGLIRGARFDARRFHGLEIEGRVVRARSRAVEGASLRMATSAHAHV